MSLLDVVSIVIERHVVHVVVILLVSCFVHGTVRLTG